MDEISRRLRGLMAACANKGWPALSSRPLPLLPDPVMRSFEETLPPEAKLEEWREAVLDACVINFLSFHEDDPRLTLEELILWECRVALDPQVSEEAQALIERGRVLAYFDNPIPVVIHCPRCGLPAYSQALLGK